MKRKTIQLIPKTCNKCGKRIRVKQTTTTCPRCESGVLYSKVELLMEEVKNGS